MVSIKMKGQKDRGDGDGCLVVFFVPVIIFIMFMCCGCLGRMIAGNIVKPVDPTPKEEQLDFHKANFIKAVDAVKAIDEEDKMAKKKIDAIQRTYGWTVKAGKINVPLALAHNAGVEGARGQIARQVDEGMEMASGIISSGVNMYTTGGLAGVATIIGGLFAGSKVKSRRRINYEVSKNRLKTSLINTDPSMVVKVNEAAKHTIMEGNIL